MIREVEPGAAAMHEPLLHQLLCERLPQRVRYFRESHAPQAPGIGSRLVGNLGVKAAESRERTGTQRLPAFREKHEALLAGRDPQRLGREGDVVRRAARDPCELGQRHAITGAAEQGTESFAGQKPLEGTQVLLTLCRSAAPRRRGRIEHHAAADRVPRARIAHDQPVAGHRRER
ncbi:MAG TPA: hypothetical protein VEG26_05275 [Steroidobacteraceae bacterium]|nr:hypothetical protein [Steroidobacteraceae bacterium]